MNLSLSPNPSLEQLRKQAKDILKAHKQGAPTCCDVLRHLRQFARSPDAEILAGPVALNHFDLYRLERAQELEDIDFWGVLESGGVSLVEWGERFPDELPPDHLSVTIGIGSDGTRTFDVASHGARAARLAADWAEARGGSRP